MVSIWLLPVVQIAAPFVAAGLAARGVSRSVGQKERLESANSTTAATGWMVLTALLSSDLATDTESAIVEALAEVVAQADNDDTDEDRISNGHG